QQRFVFSGLVAARGVTRFLRHLHADLLRELAHRLDEGQAAVLHQEADRVAVHAAAEAVIELLARADRERRGLLAVEGAAGEVVGAALLQRQVAFDDVDDVDPGQQVLDEGSRDHRAGAADGVQPARRARTRRETSAMSARPATRGLTSPMTLPMSAAPLAPLSAIAASMIASSSAGSIAAGR